MTSSQSVKDERTKAQIDWIQMNKKFLDDIERKKLFLVRVLLLCQFVTLSLLTYLIIRL